MKKVLFVQSSLHLSAWGGAPSVAAWALEALKSRYDVTVLTDAPVDAEALNRFYGTSLKLSEFRVVMPPLVQRTIVRLDPHRYSIQEFCLLMRHAKKIKNDFDVVMSATHEADFGCPGIQYIHYPWCSHLYRERESADRLSGFRRRWELFKYRAHPWWLISRFSFARMKQNLTLVNSDWTGTKFREVYGGETTTVYPPVHGEFPDIPWEERENGFVCIGRISAEKRLENIVSILSEVRRKIPDVHLHIVGTRDNRAYCRRIRKLVSINNSWIFMHENISREELLDMITGHRYGIHARPEEHFGIAVAELVCGGCIVFAPRGGGQVEIIGDNQRLLYENKNRAVSNIIRVLTSPDDQTSLREYLHARKALFSPQRFMDRVGQIVENFSDAENS